MIYTKQNDKSPMIRRSLFSLSSALVIGLMGTSFAAEVQKKEPYYAALTREWKVPEEYKESNKSAHMYLKEHEPSYRVHRADLRFSFFPLNDREQFGPLVASWEAKLEFNNLLPFLGKIHSAYQAYLELPTESQDVSYKQRAELGATITMSKWETGDRTKTNKDRLERLEKIINDPDFPQELRAKAAYNLIEHKVKHSMIEPTTPPVSYTPEAARADYRELLALADPTTRASIVYHLAELDDEGKGLPEPNRIAAQKGFLEVLENPEAHPFTKRLAQSKLEGIAGKAK